MTTVGRRDTLGQVVPEQAEGAGLLLLDVLTDPRVDVHVQPSNRCCSFARSPFSSLSAISAV